VMLRYVLSLVFIFSGIFTSRVGCEALECHLNQICKQIYAVSLENRNVTRITHPLSYPSFCGAVHASGDIYCTKASTLVVSKAYLGNIDVYLSRELDDTQSLIFSNFRYYVSSLDKEAEIDVHIHLVNPPYGSFISNGCDLIVSIIGDERFEYINFTTAQNTVLLDPHESKHGSIASRQKGSEFFTLAATSKSNLGSHSRNGYLTYGYVESVFTPEELRGLRRFYATTTSSSKREIVTNADNFAHSSRSVTEKQRRKYRRNYGEHSANKIPSEHANPGNLPPSSHADTDTTTKSSTYSYHVDAIYHDIHTACALQNKQVQNGGNFPLRGWGSMLSCSGSAFTLNLYLHLGFRHS